MCEFPKKNSSKTIRAYSKSRDIHIPDCIYQGIFPVPSNSSLFHTCKKEGNYFIQNVYVCPGNGKFNKKRKKCSCILRNTPTIVLYSSENVDSNVHFPSCRAPGKFR